MAELVTLTAPVYVSNGVDKFRVWNLILRRSHPDRSAGIEVTFREVDANGAFISGGKSLECRYEGATAQTLINSLNKANLSTNSLEKRVMSQCQTDGLIGSGSISGSPD